MNCGLFIAVFENRNVRSWVLLVNESGVKETDFVNAPATQEADDLGLLLLTCCVILGSAFLIQFLQLQRNKILWLELRHPLMHKYSFPPPPIADCMWPDPVALAVRQPPCRVLKRLCSWHLSHKSPIAERIANNKAIISGKWVCSVSCSSRR